MPTVFINLILFLVLYVLIAIYAMKLLNISFGIALGGTLCIKNILIFYEFLVLWVPNGLNIFYIMIGSNMFVIIKFHFLLI